MSASPPRLVATDLDGTLLDAAGEVSERTRAVLLELDRRDVPVVFVTGRPIRWMTQLWADVGGHGLAICSNGGLVYDVGADAVREAHGLAPGVLGELAGLLEAQAPGVRLAVETTEGFARHEEWPLRGDDRLTAEPPVFADVAAFAAAGPPVVKLLARSDGADPETFWREAERAVGDLATVTWSSLGPMVEISAAGVTKASTLELLCAELGVAAADVVAFGDMPNDVPLLSWAGRSYAMADAHPVARAAAHGVAGRHDEDGVAEQLIDLFGLDRGRLLR